MKKKPTWSFTVRNTADIDIQRILDETPDNEPWLIIADRHGNPIALFIREEFLNKFTSNDAIEVYGEYLHPFWGRPGIPLLVESSGILYAHRTRILIGRLIGWRSAPVNNSRKEGPNQITFDDILVLKKAQRIIDKTKVKIYVASDC